NLTSETWDEGLNTVFIYGNDTVGNVNNTESISFTVDTIFPIVNISFPVNSSNFSTQSVVINYTIVETNLYNCWYTNSSGLFNYTITCGDNITTATWDLGMNNVTIYANDSVGQINSNTTSFNTSVSNTEPRIINVSVSSVGVNLKEGPSNTNISINFSVSDDDGASDLVDATAAINITITGGSLNINSGVATISSTGAAVFTSVQIGGGLYRSCLKKMNSCASRS
ncbi:MAG: hypothetical protein IIA64_05545, partial [Planctomycetes bacterium]|nr:hypothetical protein [Planctomycetota bacterium]